MYRVNEFIYWKQKIASLSILGGTFGLGNRISECFSKQTFWVITETESYSKMELFSIIVSS